MSEQGDVELLEAWRGGDASAGDEFVARHFDAVFRFVSGRLGDEAEVTDLVQRTFLACLERPVGVLSARSVRAYLLGIAHKQLLMFWRGRASRAREEPVGSYQERLVASAASGLSGLVASRERQRALLLALRRLPLDLQITVELHYWEGLTMEEIAEILDMTPGGVKTRLFNARKHLMHDIDRVSGTEELAEVSLRDLGAWVSSIHGASKPRG